jgi:hypothetical protein
MEELPPLKCVLVLLTEGPPERSNLFQCDGRPVSMSHFGNIDDINGTVENFQFRFICVGKKSIGTVLD